MANHCYNYVTFEGNEKDVNAFKERFEALSRSDESHYGGVWLYSTNYNALFPQNGEIDPEEYEGEGFYNVYGDWGSKWFECTADFEKGGVTLYGDSAWSPMLPLFRKISEAYKLKGEGYYSEPGMDFAGTFKIDNGHTQEHLQYTYEGFLFHDDYEYAMERLFTNIEEGYYEGTSWSKFKSDYSSLIKYTKDWSEIELHFKKYVIDEEKEANN